MTNAMTIIASSAAPNNSHCEGSEWGSACASNGGRCSVLTLGSRRPTGWSPLTVPTSLQPCGALSATPCKRLGRTVRAAGLSVSSRRLPVKSFRRGDQLQLPPTLFPRIRMARTAQGPAEGGGARQHQLQVDAKSANHGGTRIDRLLDEAASLRRAASEEQIKFLSRGGHDLGSRRIDLPEALPKSGNG
jgi:hypothetical protein